VLFDFSVVYPSSLTNPIGSPAVTHNFSELADPYEILRIGHPSENLLTLPTYLHSPSSEFPLLQPAHFVTFKLSQTFFTLKATKHTQLSPLAMLLWSVCVAASTRALCTVTSEQNVTLTDILFNGCTNSQNGGAVYLSHSAIFATILTCTFRKCSVSSDSSSGGAIYFDGPSLTITSSTFLLCRSAYVCSCVAAHGRASPSVQSFSSTNVAALSGQSQFMTWGGFASQSTNFSFTQANFTANEVSVRGSGLASHGRLHLTLQFIDIRSNVGPACLYLAASSSGGARRCLAVRSNKCDRTVAITESHTLFYSSVAWTMSDSVFAGNSADSLAGGQRLTFVGCVFDTLSFRAAERGEFATIKCRVGAASFPGFVPDCPGGVRNPAARLRDQDGDSEAEPAHTPGLSDYPTQGLTTSPEPQRASLALPLALGIVGGLAIVGVVAFLAWRHCTAEKPPESGLPAPHPDEVISEALIDAADATTVTNVDLTLDGFSVLYPQNGKAPAPRGRDDALWELSDD
jgi:hypothetical protein